MNEDKTPDQVDKDFNRLCIVSLLLFSKKNTEYDSAFRKYGLLGVVFEILGIVNRLPPMTIWRPVGEYANVQKLRDLFVDLHNYSNMALILLEENNWDGRHPIAPREGETDEPINP